MPMGDTFHTNMEEDGTSITHGHIKDEDVDMDPLTQDEPKEEDEEGVQAVDEATMDVEEGDVEGGIILAPMDPKVEGPMDADTKENFMVGDIKPLIPPMTLKTTRLLMGLTHLPYEAIISHRPTAEDIKAGEVEGEAAVGGGAKKIIPTRGEGEMTTGARN